MAKFSEGCNLARLGAKMNHHFPELSFQAGLRGRDGNGFNATLFETSAHLERQRAYFALVV
jgi:hypothetical protein